MKLSRRDKRVIAAGLLVAIGIVAWSYVLSPMQRRWQRASKALEADLEDLQKLQRVANDRHYQEQERQRVAELVRETPDLDAPQQVVPLLISDVRGVGQGHGIRITRYEPLPPKVEETYAIYSLNLGFQASLSQLVGFLEDLQRHEPVIAVRRVHIVPPAETATIEALSVEMLLSTYALEATPSSDEEAETASLGEPDAG